MVCCRDDHLSHRSRRPARPPVSRHPDRARAGGRAAPEPAGVDSGQLPGARVRAPSLGPRRDAGQRAGGAARSSTRPAGVARCRGRGPLRVELQRLRVRPLGARGLSRCRPRLLQRHQPVPARRRPRSRGASRSSSARCPTGWQVATALRGRAGAARRGPLPRRRLRRAGRPARSSSAASGAARSSAAGVPHEFVVAGALPRLRRRAAARRRAAHLRGADRVLARRRRPSRAASAPFERYVFLLNAVEDGHGGLEHRASTALIAPRRDLPRRGADDAGDGYVNAARPDQPRVFPHLERQAAAAGRVRALRLHARELHRAAVVLRRLHVVLRRPVRCCAAG